MAEARRRGRDFVWVVATGRPRSQGERLSCVFATSNSVPAAPTPASSITRPEPGGRAPLIGAARSIADGRRSPEAGRIIATWLDGPAWTGSPWLGRPLTGRWSRPRRELVPARRIVGGGRVACRDGPRQADRRRDSTACGWLAEAGPRRVGAVRGGPVRAVCWGERDRDGMDARVPARVPACHRPSRISWCRDRLRPPTDAVAGCSAPRHRGPLSLSKPGRKRTLCAGQKCSPGRRPPA